MLLQETFEYLRESTEYLHPPPPPDNAMSKRLYKVMKLDILLGSIKVRVDDIEKILDGASNELINLQQVCHVVAPRPPLLFSLLFAMLSFSAFTSRPSLHISSPSSSPLLLFFSCLPELICSLSFYSKLIERVGTRRQT